MIYVFVISFVVIRYTQSQPASAKLQNEFKELALRFGTYIYNLVIRKVNYIVSFINKDFTLIELVLYYLLFYVFKVVNYVIKFCLFHYY